MNKCCASVIITCALSMRLQAIELPFTGFVSVFGDKIYSPREDYTQKAFQYGIPDVATASTTVGNGFVTTFTSMAVVRTSGKAGDIAQVQSNSVLRYRPGHEGVAFFTAAFTGGAGGTGTRQLIGIWDDANGFAVGKLATTFGINVRTDTTDTFIGQANFNRDTVDGSGPSGFNLDTTKLNVFRISYGWLGAANIKFYVLSTNGVWIEFHNILQPGRSSAPSIQDPVLPIRAQVSDPNGGNVLELRTASWNTAVIGSKTTASHRYFSISRRISVTGALTDRHIVTIRNKTTYQGKTNHTQLRIAAIGGGSLKNSAFAVITKLIKNATVSGTVFTDVNGSNSIVEYSIAGTYTVGTGQTEFTLPTFNTGGGTVTRFIPQNDYNIILLPGETATITGMTFNALGDTMIGSVSWDEQF